MTQVVNLSRGQLRFSAQSKGKLLTIRFGEGDYLIFWDGLPIAVETGEALYYHAPKPSSAITKALATHSLHLHVRIVVDADQFDFIVGSLLTKVGLSLTRKV